MLASTLGLADVGTLGGDHAPALVSVSRPQANDHEAFDRPSAAETPLTESPTPAVAPAPDERVVAVQRLLRGRPLEPLAAAMVAAADQHGIDWRLMPVISILESQAGLAACGGNAWGWAGCQVRFASFEEGIPIVAATLASYGAQPPATLLCIWVSGDGCHTHHAIAYSHRAAYLYAQLGGHLAVAALPPSDPLPLPPLPEDPSAAAAAPAPAAPPASGAPPSPTSTSTPSPSAGEHTTPTSAPSAPAATPTPQPQPTLAPEPTPEPEP